MRMGGLCGGPPVDRSIPRLRRTKSCSRQSVETKPLFGRAAVTPPLFPIALLGVFLAARTANRARAELFLAIVLAASAVALVRLHATGGYCTVRHGLVPGSIFTLAAAYGLNWLMSKVSVPGRWLGIGHARVRPGPAVWTAMIAMLVVIPNVRSLGPPNPGPFSVYHSTGRWLAENTRITMKGAGITLGFPH